MNESLLDEFPQYCLNALRAQVVLVYVSSKRTLDLSKRMCGSTYRRKNVS